MNMRKQKVYPPFLLTPEDFYLFYERAIKFNQETEVLAEHYNLDTGAISRWRRRLKLILSNKADYKEYKSRKVIAKGLILIKQRDGLSELEVAPQKKYSQVGKGHTPDVVASLWIDKYINNLSFRMLGNKYNLAQSSMWNSIATITMCLARLKKGESIEMISGYTLPRFMEALRLVINYLRDNTDRETALKYVNEEHLVTPSTELTPEAVEIIEKFGEEKKEDNLEDRLNTALKTFVNEIVDVVNEIKQKEITELNVKIKELEIDRKALVEKNVTLMERNTELSEKVDEIINDPRPPKGVFWEGLFGKK